LAAAAAAASGGSVSSSKLMVARSPAAALGEKEPADALCPISSIRSALKAVGATAAAIGLPMSKAELCRAATAGTLAVATAGSPKPPADAAALLLMPPGISAVLLGSPAILLSVPLHPVATDWRDSTAVRKSSQVVCAGDPRGRRRHTVHKNPCYRHITPAARQSKAWSNETLSPVQCMPPLALDQQ
jgi:hypothetical protein